MYTNIHAYPHMTLNILSTSKMRSQASKPELLKAFQTQKPEKMRSLG